MDAIIEINNKTYKVDLSKPLDISIPLQRGAHPTAFFAPPYKAEPLEAGSFIGDLSKGSPVNFYNIFINPHGNGTHTESVLHVDSRGKSINDTLRSFHFISRLITLEPVVLSNGDQVLSLELLEKAMIGIEDTIDALIIRTSPNASEKISENYSGKNPIFLQKEFIEGINKMNIKHLLLDLPSVDKEKDGGALVCHKTFWQCNDQIRKDKTITELIFVDNSIGDGLYLLNLQIISLDIDASPSKPILYKLLQQ